MTETGKCFACKKVVYADELENCATCKTKDLGPCCASSFFHLCIPQATEQKSNEDFEAWKDQQEYLLYANDFEDDR